MNITPEALDVVLFLAHQRHLDNTCPVDPAAIEIMPITDAESREFDDRNSRVFARIRKRLNETQRANQQTITIVDRIRQLFAPEVVTLFRKPQDTTLSSELDKSIEQQIQQDLKDDQPAHE